MTPRAEERLHAYVALVRKWQTAKNLVAPAALGELWSRHVADSAQALAALPDARRWVDVGSGAGFPGLVTATLIADEDGAAVHLVESNGRKAAFLRTVARELALPVTVHDDRIESFMQRTAPGLVRIEAVSARALAPLPKLLALTRPLLEAGAAGVFHKGQDFASELAETTQSWAFDLVEHRSRIDPAGRIVVLRNVAFRC
ncbi:16S rRNA (guanine(527)-N(7))-methyltransferase RsmG [Methylobrevis pamukkalensis]|uniref:Ribosomal RNA small subunit methyltransferase G n=1 Tax=Methylobrevis pamukkalensis TaxID=1439726 RepID=A0A1E3H9F6_9HYPH|nr:16S rRNA (guanine(527)-N(7))-methyltransferase RsmG [Methylobrevis pamukkalensis]ODN72121.1 Ribosomal RNA small subunit methyltransferase G [Methylobrevis pamukkalensis]